MFWLGWVCTKSQSCTKIISHSCKETGSETFESGFFLKKSIINPANPKTTPMVIPNITPLINIAKDSLK